MKFFYTLIFIFLSQICFSQNKKTSSISVNQKNNGYLINIQTKNLKNKSLKLSFYKGSFKNTILVDSSKIVKDDQKIVFTQKNGILSFPIQISTDDAHKILLFVRNGINISFSLNENFINPNFTDPLNKDFYAYSLETNLDRKKELKNQMLSKYKDTGLQMYFKLEDKIALKNTSQDPNFYKKKLEGLNLEENNLFLMPNTYAFLNSYFDNPNNFEVYTKELDYLLSKLNCDNLNYQYTLNWILKNLQYQDLTNNNALEKYEYLYNQYIKNSKCKEITKKFGPVLEHNINNQQQIPIGKAFPDVKMRDLTDKEYSIYDYLKQNPKPTVLIFFDPNCEHCVKNVPEKVKEIKAIEETEHIKINKIAYLYVGDENEWQKFIVKYNMQDWLNVKSPKEKPIFETLSINGTPQFYILDKNGVVLSKFFNKNLIISESKL